jgi:hypothetical protein
MCVHLPCVHAVFIAHAVSFRPQLLDSSDSGFSAPPSLLMSSCLLDSNRAILDGGAAVLTAGAATFSGGAVSSNAAGGDGGGVSVKARSHVFTRLRVTRL